MVTPQRAPPRLSDLEADGKKRAAIGDDYPIAEYNFAIERHAASFHQLGAAIFYSKEEFNDSEPERFVYERYIKPLTKAFEIAHGAIVHSFYCQHVIAAVVLSDRPELSFILPPLDAGIVPVAIADLLFECDRLNVEADRVLGRGPSRSRDLKTTQMLIYAAVVNLCNLIDCIDSEKRPASPSRSILDLHRREVRHAHDYYQRAAERLAKFDYFCGMLIGVAVCSALVAAGAWTLLGFGPDGRILVSCLAAGGIGAVVSVMSRITFGELSLDYEAGRGLLFMFGAFRPVIGMALGAAMMVLAASGILPIGPRSGSTKELFFFYTLIAFLAGFSERWAQDMLRRTADQISIHDNNRRKNRVNKPSSDPGRES